MEFEQVLIGAEAGRTASTNRYISGDWCFPGVQSATLWSKNKMIELCSRYVKVDETVLEKRLPG